MAYTKIVFQNSPSTATPLNAENLNHMDDQIALNDQRLTEIETSYVKSFNGRKGEVAPENGDYDIGQIAPLTGAQVGQVPVVVNHGTEQDPELAFEMGAGGGGGHSIIDSEGNTMPQESAMQFADSHVSDDPTNGKTVIENIKEHTTKADYDQATEDGFHVIDDGNDVPIGEIEEDYVEVTADGVKTVATLLSELYAEIDFDKVTDTAYLSVSDGTVFALTRRLTNELRFGASHTTGTDRVVTLAIRIKELSSDCQFTQNTAQSNGNTIASNNAYQYPNGTKITLYYGTSSTVINLKTSANYCMMSDEETSVEDALTNGIVSATNLQAQSTAQAWVAFGSITLNKGKYLAIGCAQHGTIDGICGISIKVGSVGEGNTKASILGSRSYEISSATVTDILDITNDNTTVYFCVWIEGAYTITPVSFKAIRISL